MALSAEIVNRRLASAAQDMEEAAGIQPRIEGHLRVYEDAIDALIAEHQRLVERSDLDLEATTRWVAVWELSGRCLGICKLIVYEMRGGFTSEAVGTMRTLHEAVHLLSAAAFAEEEDIARRWLAGDYVRPKEARDAMSRQAAYAQDLMRQAGVEPEAGTPIDELATQIYDVLSRPAHHRRGGFNESISRAMRLFVYGPHPNPQTRAVHVAYAGELLEEAVITVGGALGSIFGPSYFRDQVKPLVEGFEHVRNLMPLPD
jgi:hypothetical protein